MGSFVNVLIDRSMAWYGMLPIFSYVFYLSKSRCCKKTLSYRYPLVELLVGLLFTWWLAVGFWFFQLVNMPLSSVQPMFWLISGIILAILALADLFYGVILMGIVWVGVAMTILYRFILVYYGAFQVDDLGKAILLASGFYAFFWLLWKLTGGRGMAEGDMYIALYMGLLLGWPKGIVALMGSFILGAVIALILMVFGKKKFGQTIPFGPFMILGIVVGLLWGEQILRLLF